MKNKSELVIVLVCTAVLVLACGVSTELPTPTQPPAVEIAAPLPTAAPTLTAAPNRLVVCAEVLNVRACPSLACGVLARLDNGTQVQPLRAAIVAADMELWQEIDADGIGGFVDPKYLCKVGE